MKRIKEQYFFIRQRANPQTRKIHSANTPLSLFRLQRYDMKKPLSSSTPPFDSFIGQAEQLTHILPKDNNYRLFDYRYKRAHSPNSSPDSIKEFLFDPYIFIYIWVQTTSIPKYPLRKPSTSQFRFPSRATNFQCLPLRFPAIRF